MVTDCVKGRQGIRERMDARLKPDISPELLPGVWWLLAHGSSTPVFSVTPDGCSCSAQLCTMSEGRRAWVDVTGSVRHVTAWWRATVRTHSGRAVDKLVRGLKSYRSLDVAIAVGVQLERLDAELRKYDESKEKDNDQTGRKEEAGG